MKQLRKLTRRIVCWFLMVGWAFSIHGQVPPTSVEISKYTGLLAAVAQGDERQIEALVKKTVNIDIRDEYGRTPLHIAAYEGNHAAMRILVRAGADPNALEKDRYDIVTIAAVANDVDTLVVALKLGASAKNITSPYDGTALIAAAHLGHVEVVQSLIEAGAPLNHVNNLGWTALIESIILGDGGRRHTDTLRALINAGANLNLTTNDGHTPLELAQSRGYQEMVSILQRAAI